MSQYVDAAIARVRLAYDALQVRAPGEKLYVAYSGGKDSECIMQICREAIGECAIEAHYHATGIDPPELVKHVKAQFRAWQDAGIECHFDKEKLLSGITMHNLIVKKGPPTRNHRFCCEHFKEGGGIGRVVITGVRWAEGTNRKANHGAMTVRSKHKELRAIYDDDNDMRRMIIEPCPAKSKITVNPIVDWSTKEVWSFIRERQIPHCGLYREGFHRLGCIGCPNARFRGKARDFKRWPHMVRYYRKAFADMLTAHPEYVDRYNWNTVDDVWHWWLEDGIIPGQIEMELEEAGP